jgi:tRNA1(Val) A37 N6-methylase TrmN6
MPGEAGIAVDTSDDAVLGSRLRLLQPLRGHRFGHDAILLAAATQARAGELAVDLGAGVGAAGLSLAQRVGGLTVRLVEIDAELAAIAEENARRNGLGDRVSALALDVASPAEVFAAAGLGAGCAARVLMNPPFNDETRAQSSPDRRRRFAHVAPPEALSVWIKAAGGLLGPGGVLTLIWRADGLAGVLTALEGELTAEAILPVYPGPSAPAIRILVRAVKGGRRPLALLPGLVLNDETGRPTPEAEAVVRHGAELPLGSS